MPLEQSNSRSAIGHNIATEVHHGKPQKQAEAIAISTAKKNGGYPAKHGADEMDSYESKYASMGSPEEIEQFSKDYHEAHGLTHTPKKPQGQGVLGKVKSFLGMQSKPKVGQPKTPPFAYASDWRGDMFNVGRGADASWSNHNKDRQASKSQDQNTGSQSSCSKCGGELLPNGKCPKCDAQDEAHFAANDSQPTRKPDATPETDVCPDCGGRLRNVDAMTPHGKTIKKVCTQCGKQVSVNSDMATQTYGAEEVDQYEAKYCSTCEEHATIERPGTTPHLYNPKL